MKDILTAVYDDRLRNPSVLFIIRVCSFCEVRFGYRLACVFIYRFDKTRV